MSPKAESTEEKSSIVPDTEALLHQLPELNLAVGGRLPGLCTLEPGEMEEIETQIEKALTSTAEAIGDGALAVVSIGRGRFEVVPGKEAEQLRLERRDEVEYQSSRKHRMPAHLKDEAALFTTLSTRSLGEKVARELDIEVGTLDVKQFKDGELSLSVKKNVRDREVFLLAGTSNPVNEQLMELFITVDALRRASARRVTLVMPYSGYARQDKKLDGREPISAKLVAKLLETSGVDRVVTLNIHSDQSIGFYDIPIDNLKGSSVLLPYLRKKYAGEDLVIISPDKGGVPRATMYASELGAPFAMIYKKRERPNEVGEMKVLGDVEGKTCLIVDDMTDTGGTLVKAAEMLKAAGAHRVVAACVHPVFSADAVEKLRASAIDEVVTTDTVPLRRAKGVRFTVISTAALLAEGIRRMMTRESLTELAQLEVEA